MTMFAIHLEDDPARTGERERLDSAHRAYLAGAVDRVVLAGALGRTGPGELASGELWVVRAASELEARELIEADPLFVAGVRRSIRVWPYDALQGPGRGPEQ